MKLYKNLGRGLTVALITLSSLSAIVYHDDVIAGKGNGGGNGGGNNGGKGGSKANSKASGNSNGNSHQEDISNLGIGPKAYNKWLSDLIKE